MKKLFSLLLASAMVLSLVACGSSDKPAASAPAASGEAAAFVPSADIDWIVTSSPGGGSDIYSRMITDIMSTEGWVTETFLVTNLTDGGGEVGRLQVAMTKAGKDADHTLLTFNSGDLMPMCLNTDNRIQNFTPIALMAVDKQLLFTGPGAKYATFADALAAAQAGTPVVIGGSKGDDVATYEAMIAELGLTEAQMPYITYDGTGDAITAVLGGHVDMVISKPAAASQYVASTDPASTSTPFWLCPPSVTAATWPTLPPCPRLAITRTLRFPCGAALSLPELRATKLPPSGASSWRRSPSPTSGRPTTWTRTCCCPTT